MKIVNLCFLIFQTGDMVRCGKISVQAPERPMEPYVRVYFRSSFVPNGRGFNISFKQYEKGNNTIINRGGMHILEKYYFVGLNLESKNRGTRNRCN